MSIFFDIAARKGRDQSKKKIKYLKKKKGSTVRSKLGGTLESDQASDLELDLKLELNGPKPKVGSQTFPSRSLNSVMSGGGGKIFLILFLIVLRYSTESSREWSSQGCSSWEW